MVYKYFFKVAQAKKGLHGPSLHAGQQVIRKGNSHFALINNVLNATRFLLDSTYFISRRISSALPCLSST